MYWLFVPLQDADVLVHGERVLYRSRRHWAAVAPEFLQFVAVVFLHLAFAIGDTATGVGGLAFVGVVLSAVALWPLVRDRRSRRHLVGAAVVIFLIVSAGFTIVELGALVVIFMGCRFIVRVLRWAFYQRTYLTDRRVMEVDGFVGSTVNSMPLSKVTDVMLYRPPLGEVLGYGTFRVESAGQDQALGRLDYLIDPERFHDLVVASPSWR